MPYVTDYILAIENAGGNVDILPADIPTDSLHDAFSQLDGLILSGGGDIDPVIFHGEPHPSVEGIIPERDATEISLTKLAILHRLPFLGICRGIQVMNVALGGTLFTDLPDQLGKTVAHSTEKRLPKNTINHMVKVKPDSWLYEVTRQKELPVNSRHHQGIKLLAEGLDVMAIAPDGLIEAVHLRGHPYGIGVQWHPENLPEVDHARTLFETLIRAAAG